MLEVTVRPTACLQAWRAVGGKEEPVVATYNCMSWHVLLAEMPSLCPGNLNELFTSESGGQGCGCVSVLGEEKGDVITTQNHLWSVTSGQWMCEPVVSKVRIVNLQMGRVCCSRVPWTCSPSPSTSAAGVSGIASRLV